MNLFNQKRDQINDLKEKSSKDSISVSEKELAYEKIDNLEQEIINKIEEVLSSILPTAFAIIKETAQRFKDNTEIKVQANENDVLLASKKILYQLVTIRLYIKILGMQQEQKFLGIWYIMMFS